MMRRLMGSLHAFAAGYLPTEARRPDMVRAVGLVGAGVLLATLGSIAVRATVALFDVASVGLAVSIVFIAGCILGLDGKVVLTISSVVEKPRR